MVLLFKLNLITLLSDSSLRSGIYNHVSLSSIPSREVSRGLILPSRKTGIFKGDSVDYGTKSICGSE
jgi:hypothetical protein